jgi:hypothetical protein
MANLVWETLRIKTSRRMVRSLHHCTALLDVLLLDVDVFLFRTVVDCEMRRLCAWSVKYGHVLYLMYSLFKSSSRLHIFTSSQWTPFEESVSDKLPVDRDTRSC